MIERERLLKTFVDLAAIPSPSGSENEVARAIVTRLQGMGLNPMRDHLGNVLAQLDGEGEPFLLTAHMDTVGPCARVIPVVAHDVIYSDGSTILGADDKAGVAIILEVLALLTDHGLPHRPLDVLFTVQEETGLDGAKGCDRGRLRASMGIGLDAGGENGTIVASAPSHDELSVQVHGHSAHAGVCPEEGIDAIRVAAEAIASMPLGRIDEETTANIGIIAGGSATNIVAELVTLRGEARSRDEGKLQAQTQAMLGALERSAGAHGARVEVEVTRLYSAYKLTEADAIVRLVTRAMRSVGVVPVLAASGGGSDANVFNAQGMTIAQISAGMRAVHTCSEHVALADMVKAAEVVLACVSP